MSAEACWQSVKAIGKHLHGCWQHACEQHHKDARCTGTLPAGKPERRPVKLPVRHHHLVQKLALEQMLGSQGPGKEKGHKVSLLGVHWS